LPSLRQSVALIFDRLTLNVRSTSGDMSSNSVQNFSAVEQSEAA